MDYEEAKKHKAFLEEKTIHHSRELNKLPGINSGSMGMTPENIKQSPEYKLHKQGYATAHEQLRKFNQTFTKQFKKEYADERAAKRKILQEHEQSYWDKK